MVHPQLRMSCVAFDSLLTTNGVAPVNLHHATCNSAHASLAQNISLLLTLGFTSARMVGF